MKMYLAIQNILTIATFLTAPTQAYRNPAQGRPSRSHYDYRNYHPSQRGSGSFGLRNQSLVPWEAHRPPINASIPMTSVMHDCSATSHKSSAFWLPGVPHQGTSPFLSDSSNYVVYRNVKDFGAKGDGITDDSAAFNAAIACMLLPDTPVLRKN